MDTKTPTKIVSRISVTPTGKTYLCILCGFNITNQTYRLKLFYKDRKTSHCMLIEKVLNISISSSTDFVDHVCKNCLSKCVTVDNKSSNLKEMYSQTREKLAQKYTRVSTKRLQSETVPSSKRPLFQHSEPISDAASVMDTFEMGNMSQSLKDVSTASLVETTEMTPVTSKDLIFKAQCEIKNLAAVKTSSVLRGRKNVLTDFSIETVNKELETVAPTFTKFIKGSIENPQHKLNKKRKDENLKPEIVSASAKLLHAYNQDLNLFQTLQSIILLKAGTKQTAFNRLSAIGDTLTYRGAVNVVDRLSSDWHGELVQWKEQIQNDRIMEETLTTQIETLDDTIDLLGAQNIPTITLTMEIEESRSQLKRHRDTMHPGYYFVGDNVDLRTGVRQMTRFNQNKDFHMYQICCYKNRVSGNDLDDSKPKGNVSSVPFAKFVPNEDNLASITSNFAFLVAHTWCDFIPWLHPFKCTLKTHLEHKHMPEMTRKTERINMGVLLKNEQYNDQMVDICQYMHSQVPCHNDDPNDTTEVPVKTLSGGDYLTFERHKSAQSSMANGRTPSSRLEGLIPKMEEFHNQAELLKVIWHLLYSTQSARETGTLYAARNSVDAKNVTNDPHTDFYAAAELLRKFSVAYIVCGALDHFGMENTNDEASNNCYNGEIGNAAEMSSYLITQAKQFVSNNVAIDIPEIPKYGYQSNQLVCRFCQRTYKKAKSLRKHEATVHSMSDPMYSVSDSITQNKVPTDNILNYTKCALFLCLMYMNHADALQLGDGERIMASNKYLCFLYKANNCPKYAYGLLETQAQCEVLLSERNAYQLKWNRTVNHQGRRNSNHPNDLDLEHQNKTFKEHVKSFRGQYTEKTIARASQTAATTDKIVRNYDKVVQAHRPSGSHTKSNATDDILLLVGQIHDRKIFSNIPGRKYNGIDLTTSNPFDGLHADKLRDWLSASLKKYSQEHFYSK